MKISKIAEKIRKGGVNVLPANKQTKRPALKEWKKYQKEVCKTPITEQVNAIAIVCGSISGNLEVIDFDFQGEAFDEWKARVPNELFKRLYVERTQSGGYHVVYKCADTIGRNAKLCERLLQGVEISQIKSREVYGKTVEYVEYKRKKVDKALDGSFGICTIETRGEGGICIVAPTENYEVIQGDLSKLAILSKEEREILISSAMALSTIVRKPILRNADSILYDTTKADDDFDVAQFLREDDASRKLLTRYGWTLIGDYQEEDELWRRPGKTSGVSGKLNKRTGCVYIWTSNASISPLQANVTYTPLQLLAELEHNGDERAAARKVVDTVRKSDLQEYEQPLRIVVNACKADKQADVPNQTKNADELPASIYDIKLPNECLNPGGYLGALMDYIDENSKRKQRTLALGASMTFLGHLAARRIAYGKRLEVSPTLYTIAVAPPSSGKNSALECVNRIANAEKGECRLHPLEIQSRYESINAFYDLLAATGRQAMFSDEFGAWFANLQNDRENSFRRRLIDAFLILFSSYSNTAFNIPVSLRLLKENGTLTISRPAFSLYGVSNFYDLRNALSGRASVNGFVARCSFVIGDNKSEIKFADYMDEIAEFEEQETPSEITDSLFEWIQFNPPSKIGGCKPKRIGISKDAYELYTEYANKVSNQRYLELDETENFALKTMLGRAGEKVMRYALIFSASRFGASQFEIDTKSMEQAIAFSEYNNKIFQWLTKNELAENKEEYSEKKLLNYIRERKMKELSARQVKDVLRTELKQTRDAVVASLIARGVLERVVEVKGKTSQKRLSYLVNWDEMD